MYHNPVRTGEDASDGTEKPRFPPVIIPDPIITEKSRARSFSDALRRMAGGTSNTGRGRSKKPICRSLSMDLRRSVSIEDRGDRSHSDASYGSAATELSPPLSPGAEPVVFNTGAREREARFTLPFTKSPRDSRARRWLSAVSTSAHASPCVVPGAHGTPLTPLKSGLVKLAPWGKGRSRTFFASTNKTPSTPIKSSWRTRKQRVCPDVDSDTESPSSPPTPEQSSSYTSRPEGSPRSPAATGKFPFSSTPTESPCTPPSPEESPCSPPSPREPPCSPSKPEESCPPPPHLDCLDDMARLSAKELNEVSTTLDFSSPREPLKSFDSVVSNPDSLEPDDSSEDNESYLDSDETSETEEDDDVFAMDHEADVQRRNGPSLPRRTVPKTILRSMSTEDGSVPSASTRKRPSIIRSNSVSHISPTRRGPLKVRFEPSSPTPHRREMVSDVTLSKPAPWNRADSLVAPSPDTTCLRKLAVGNWEWPWAAEDLLRTDFVTLGVQHRWIRNKGCRNAVVLATGGLFLTEVPVEDLCRNLGFKEGTEAHLTFTHRPWYVKLDVSNLVAITVPMSPSEVELWASEETPLDRMYASGSPNNYGAVFHSRSGQYAWVMCESGPTRDAMIRAISMWHLTETRTCGLDVRHVPCEEVEQMVRRGKRGALRSLLTERKTLFPRKADKVVDGTGARG